MSTIHLRRVALRDIREARDWYEQRQPGLGQAFVNAVQDGVDLIGRAPETYALVSGRTRRAPLSRFPYSILYVATRNRITITAVLHWKRHPHLWTDRMRDAPVGYAVDKAPAAA
jgi:plasmid stabilization system protein ParE